MKIVKSEQAISQLEKRKGGYFYLQLDAELVNSYEKKRSTRLICKVDNVLSFQCGLNHLGDGNFFIILSSKNLKTLGKSVGDNITFELTEDPNPLGVEIPAVLEALLEQDLELKNRFQALTIGKQRSVIHQISKIKDVDRQISKAPELVISVNKPRRKQG